MPSCSLRTVCIWGTCTACVPRMKKQPHLASPPRLSREHQGAGCPGQQPETQIGIPGWPLSGRVTLAEHLAQAGLLTIRPRGAAILTSNNLCTLQGACDSVQGICSLRVFPSWPCLCGHGLLMCGAQTDPVSC